jgi:hypothetical protein
VTKRAKAHLAAQAEPVGATNALPPNEAPPAAVKTMSVPQAGKLYFGLSRNGSYEAARRGDLPIIRVGRLLRVVPSVLEARLAEAGRTPATPE